MPETSTAHAASHSETILELSDFEPSTENSGNAMPVAQHSNAGMTRPSESRILTPDSLKNKYLFLQEIGHGSQAHVYLAIRLEDGLHVVVKQLNIGSVKNWKEYELFKREADILSSLNIDGVAKFYDAMECLEDEPPCSYIVQEYIQGTSLRQIIQTGHRFKINDVFDVVIQLLNILSQLQDHNPPIIHRDIKPSNIMISMDENNHAHVTLIDFGAVANPQVQGGGSTVAGTYGYMPPEQLMGKPVPASDIYSVAAVAVEMCTGKSPAILPTKDFRLIFEPEMEQMPQPFINTLRQMLEPKAENRLTNIPELISTFENFKSNQYQTAHNNTNSCAGIAHQLTNIQSIGDPGNIDIWQSLPDETPRHLPELLNKNLYITSPNNRKKLRQRYVFTFCLLLIIFIIMLIILPATLTGIAVICGISTLLLLLFKIAKNETRPHESLSSAESLSNRYSSNLHKTESYIYDLYRNVLENGRKTIATITNISYIPLNQMLKKTHDLYIYPYKPSFLVEYKFNPPDDSKGDTDLFHSCVVHEAPEGHYQIGDPLPILYTLELDNFTEKLVSIPFPFPLNQTNLKEICYEQINKTTMINFSPSNAQYINCLAPLLKALRNDNRNDTIRAIQNLSNFTCRSNPDIAILQLMFEIGNTILEKKDSELDYYYMNALHYLSTKTHLPGTHDEIIQYIVNYLNNSPENITPGAVHGLLSLDRYVITNVSAMYNYKTSALDDVSVHEAIALNLLSPAYHHLFFNIIHSWCNIIAASELNAQIYQSMLQDIKATIAGLPHNSSFSAVINAIMTSSLRFNNKVFYTLDCFIIFDDISQKFVYINYPAQMRTIMEEILHNPVDLVRLGNLGIITPDLLKDPEYEPIQSLITEYLCATNPLSLLEYIQNISNYPYILHGIACYIRNRPKYSCEAMQLPDKIYNSLLEAYPTADPETKRWMRFETTNRNSSRLCLPQSYLANFPQHLTHKVFHTPELSDLSLAVLIGCSKDPLNPDAISPDNQAYLDVIRDYFSQNLMDNESQHIRVFIALVNYLPNALSSGISPFLPVCADICQRCSNDFFNIIMKHVGHFKFKNTTFYDYIMDNTLAGKAG